MINYDEMSRKKTAITSGLLIAVISITIWLFLVLKFLIFIIKGWNNIHNNPYTFMSLEILPVIPVVLLSFCVFLIIQCITMLSNSDCNIFNKTGNQFLMIFTVAFSFMHLIKHLLYSYANESFMTENGIPSILSHMEILVYGFLAVGGFFYYFSFRNKGHMMILKNLLFINMLILSWGIIMELLNKPYLIISISIFWFVILPSIAIISIYHFIKEEYKRKKLLEIEIEYIESGNLYSGIKNDTV